MIFSAVKGYFRGGWAVYSILLYWGAYTDNCILHREPAHLQSLREGSEEKGLGPSLILVGENSRLERGENISYIQS